MTTELLLEAEFSPGMTAAENQEIARLIEQAGFDRLGISDVVLWPDTFLVQALCAQVTERVEIGSMVSSPYLRHPAAIAAAVADLDDISGGRAFIGLGVGAGLDAVGLQYSRPVATLRDTITIIRALLDGESLTYDGPVYQTKGAKLRKPPNRRIPIAVGTRSEQVAKLSGELADRALVGARYLSPTIATQYAGWVEAGRARTGREATAVEIAPRLTLCCSPDGDAARRTQRRDTADFLVALRPADLEIEPERFAAIEEALSRSQGWYFDPEGSYPAELDELVTDDLVDKFSISGRPEETVAHFQRLRELGFGTASLKLAPVRKPGYSMFDGLKETITSFAKVLPSIKG
ncbi:MAG: LLM class flavin-dependent oxidoreductase [Jatrophihabitantaceae bacterium]